MFTSQDDGSSARVTIYFEGTPLQVPKGLTVAAAILQAGTDATRITPLRHEERGPFCLMGVCYECLMEINGKANQQSCLIQVEEGMRVNRQIGEPSFLPKEKA